MKGSPLKKKLAAVALLVVVGLSACSSTQGSGNKSAVQQASDKAASNKVYIPKNHVELDNYNKRQQLADDPTTILWCTFSFATPGSPLVTIPIVGKLTSGSKRPFPEHQTVDFSSVDSTHYSPDLPGADGMYGSSGDYRYGFTPEQSYADFSSLPSFCTTSPMIWQHEKTTLALSIDTTLTAASNAAQAQLKGGNKAGASDTLKKAINQAGGK